MLTIHLLPNAHLDPVWQWDRREGLNAGIATLRSVLTLMDERPDLTFMRGESVVYGAASVGSCGVRTSMVVTPALVCCRTSQSSAARRCRASRSRAVLAITASAASGIAPVMMVMPSLMMPAFSNAISSSVCPRYCWWSKPIEVMAPSRASRTLVAS